MQELDKEQIKINMTIAVNLEYLGVHFEDVKEEDGSWGLLSKTAYYYSVPESSTLEIENKELNARIKSADGLKHLAKEAIIDMIIGSSEKIFGEDSEFIDELKNNISDYFKFYAKVRTGEVWNKELAEQRMKDLQEEIEAANEYKEI